MLIIRAGYANPPIYEFIDARLARAGLPLPRTHESDDGAAATCGAAVERPVVLAYAAADARVSCAACKARARPAPAAVALPPAPVSVALAAAMRFALRVAASIVLVAAAGLCAQGPAAAQPLQPSELREALQRCAPHVHPQTQAALVAVESAGDPLAIHDNNTGATYFPRSRAAALATASAAIDADQRRGRSGAGVDVGLGQIDSHNFKALGTSIDAMLDPCANLAASSLMLRRAYHAHGDVAAALQVYNSGSPHGDDRYVARVRAAAVGGFVRSVMHAPQAQAPRAITPRQNPAPANVPARPSHFYEDR